MFNTRARASLSSCLLIACLASGCAYTSVHYRAERGSPVISQYPDVISVSLIQGTAVTNSCTEDGCAAHIEHRNYELSKNGAEFLTALSEAAAVYGIFSGLWDLLGEVPGAFDKLMDRRHPPNRP